MRLIDADALLKKTINNPLHAPYIVEKDIREMPTIQPVATDINVGDMVSRQVSLDAFGLSEKTRKYGGDHSGYNTMMLYEIQGILEGLPSAQPEPQWIPCSDRLPEHGGRYLISALDGIDRRTTVAPYLPRCKAWTMTGRMAYWKVIAWMPLPEPYAERREE